MPKGVIYRLTALTNGICQVISPDLENTNHDKPAQEDFPVIDWTMIDQPINPLNKEYRTQWVSLNPKKEQSHKIPKTPQDNSPKDNDKVDQYTI
jgi:hypothetical protein